MDENGNLQEIDADNYDFSQHMIVATIYNTNDSRYDLGDERHGSVMDWSTHEFIHETIGTRYESGLTGTFGNANFSITAGAIDDEDLEHAIPYTNQTVVLYRWGSVTYATLPRTWYYLNESGNLQYDNSGTLTDVSNNYHVAYWVFATNNPEYPIYVVAGQRQDLTLANARTNNQYVDLSLPEMPSMEMKILYRVILKSTAGSPSYIETQDLRSIQAVSSGTYTPTSHNILTNLDYSTSGHTGFAGTGVENTFTLNQTFLSYTCFDSSCNSSIYKDTGGNLVIRG
jgi:hypothetical protein